MELLLTVFGLLVAIYAILPRERQLDLSLRLGALDWAAIIAGILAIFYLEFYELMEARGLALLRNWPTGLSPSNTIYLVMLVLIVFLGLRIRLVRLPRRKIAKFQEFAEELLWAEHHGELLSLFQDHLKELFRIYQADFALVRLRRRLAPSPWERFRTPWSEPGERVRKQDFMSNFRLFLDSAIAKLAQFLPTYEREQRIAQETARAVLLSDGFVDALSRTRPYLGLEIIGQWVGQFDQHEFVDLYIQKLLRNPASVFYTELVNNQNLLRGDRFRIPESNRLLFFFLADANQAKELRVYKPIGDFVLQELDRLARDPDRDPYNQAMGDFKEIGAWHSPVYGAIRFFDIMVKEALFQGIEWHMWLYYFPPICEKIVRNYRISDPLANPEAEWPIRYSFLIYEMFSALRDWIIALRDIPPNQSNVVLGSTRPDHENSNIPKSSILALSQCVRYTLESDALGESFRLYLIDIVFRLYFELQSLPGFRDYGTVLREALVQGGFFSSRHDEPYRQRLIQAFERLARPEYFIKFPSREVEELEQSLRRSAEPRN